MTFGYSPDPDPEPHKYVFFRDVPVGGLFLPIPLGCICTWEKARFGVARRVRSDPGCAAPLHPRPDCQHTFAGNDPVKRASQSGVWELT